MRIKIVFLGTPSIGASALQSILNSKFFDVVAVVTALDKKIGRSHRNLIESPVAKLANKHNLKLIKTNSINENIELLENLGEFDVLLTTAYGEILTKKILSLPKFKALNIHGSLLPKGRGGAPIHWAIIKEEKETGISIMEMTNEMDAGDYYSQDIIKINKKETYDSLYEKMSTLIEKVSARRIKQIYDGILKPTKQNKRKVTKWLIIKDEDAKINFYQSALEVYNQIRGLYSKPGGYVIYGKNKRIKINEAKLPTKPTPIPMKVFREGEIVSIDQKGLFVACQTNYIYITNLTLPGKTASDVKNLINGNFPLKKGDILNYEE